ncbi:uncharacterized protein LOC129767204 [Toxorhynchites rutilus septentrionalis]|uniref:uncharacterized protein LOC129767204 n=1 Tax=Toxorhynchites rutilus septentrionalis TaxID=329112 RepID=UPI00247B013B|nr:uncharacterized protein LOC129767204 [Toxorhynchites rutilus septentrionalis]
MDDENGAPIKDTTTSSEEHIHETTSPPQNPSDCVTPKSAKTTDTIDPSVDAPDPVAASDGISDASESGLSSQEVDSSSAETAPDNTVHELGDEEQRQKLQETEESANNESPETIAIIVEEEIQRESTPPSPESTNVEEPQPEVDPRNEDRRSLNGETDSVEAQDEPSEECSEKAIGYIEESSESIAVPMEGTDADGTQEQRDDEQCQEAEKNEGEEEYQEQKEQLVDVSCDTARTKHKINGNITTNDDSALVVANDSQRSDQLEQHISKEYPDDFPRTAEEKSAMRIESPGCEVDETSSEKAPESNDLETGVTSSEKCENMDVGDPCDGSRTNDSELSETKSEGTPDIVMGQQNDESDRNVGCEDEPNNPEETIEPMDKLQNNALDKGIISECTESPQLNGEVSHESPMDSCADPVDDSEHKTLKRMLYRTSSTDSQEPSSKQQKLSDSDLEDEKLEAADVQPPINIHKTILDTKMVEVNEKLDQSVDSGKSTLEDSNEEEAAAQTSNPNIEKEQSDPHSMKEDNIEDDDLDDDKSSSSTSSSSSSSSSDSDSSDDEMKEEEEISAVRTEDAEREVTNELPKAISEEKISNHAASVKHTDVEMEESDSKSRLEIDDSFNHTSEEEEEGNGEVDDENGATITRSEGLKLSISLKRPISDEKSKDIVEESHQVDPPVQPQPVDFSNFLKQEKLLAERSELVKIEYNSKPTMHNISEQVERMETENVPSEPNPPGGYSLLNNQLKTNYVGVSSNDFLMEESSDTLDEENRLVIAEKQRRGRKKDNSPTKQQQSFQPLQTWQPALREAMQPGPVRFGLPPKSVTKRPQQPKQQPSLMKTILTNNRMSQQQHQQQQPLSMPPIAPNQIQQRHQQQVSPQIAQGAASQQPTERKKDKKKVFLCSPCGTHYENWNLFKHMREVHKKYICLYCLGIFQSAERLVNHLEAKHQVRKKHVSSIDEYQQQQSNTDGNKSLYLMCARCEHIFEKTSSTDGEAIVQHNCADYMEKCENCGCFKQSKHKCDKKAEQAGNVSLPPQETARQLGNSHASRFSSINHMKSGGKFNLNNNYNSSTINSSAAVMYNYDNQAKMSNGSHDSPQFTKTLTGIGQQKVHNKSGSNKKARFSQQQKNADLTSPLNINTQSLLNFHPQANQTLASVSGAFSSPILQSQLMKPLEAAAQLPNKIPTTYPTDILHQQSLESPITQHHQPNLLHHPPQLTTEMQHSAQKLNFDQITTLSTIPASLLNVREPPTELPPVPELPVPEPPAHTEHQQEQEQEEVSRPPLVPKLKVRIPKQFCTPLESEESSTESDYDEEEPDDQEEDDEEEAQDSDGKAHRTEEAMAHSPVTSVSGQNHRVEEDIKLDPVEMDIEEEGERQPVNLPPEMGPAPMPEGHERDNDRQSLLAAVVAAEPMVVDEPQESLPPVAADHQTEKVPLSTPERTRGQYLPSPSPLSEPEQPKDDILVANEDAQLFELTLDEPLDKIHIREFIKVCLRSTFPFCLYCNHARRIAVNGKNLALHLVATHRFQATVNSITAEELLPATIVQRFRFCLDELEPLYFNLETFDSSWTPEEKAVTYPKQFECFQCRFMTQIHKELYLHNRKMHQKALSICLMCRANFFSYSELLCHMCPGVPNHTLAMDYSFRCSLCNIDGIPSAFRLMVHLRKRHFACDVCLEQCSEQGALSNHVWKHKLHHLCYRCGIAYRNKADILKHLFWKHGTEGVLCKRCLQKKWPHVYHFCVPPAQFICDVCHMGFRKSLALKVHQRLHNGEEKYPCNEDGCEKKFISKKLLLKHVQRHYEPPPPSPSKETEPSTPESKKEVINLNVESGVVKEESVVKQEPDDQRIKTEVKEEDKPGESTGNTEETPRKKKKKRSKEDHDKSMVDLLNVPALNLSESDSSDGSDAENSIASSKRFPSAPATVRGDNSEDEASRAKEDNENEPDKSGTDQIVNIWNNFKNYQASRTNSRRTSVADEITEEQFVEKMLRSKILHVSQSDHDYCFMYKKIYPEVKAGAAGDTIVIDDDGNMEKTKRQESLLKSSSRTGSPSKKLKSPRKRKASKSGSDSSSSDSGSGSDSSCECGSNCSCSSSSSGSSTSSSDDSDSSTENKGKLKETKTKDKNNKSSEEPKHNASPARFSPPPPEEEPVAPPEPVDPDTIIHESDLETDESETDEEFYDEHPQKLANQLLAEKRRQLLQQTCMSPLNSMGIVENSRPSTPSLPEEMVAKKKIKLKKKKRERKVPKRIPPPLMLTNEPSSNIPPPINLNHLDLFTPAPIISTMPLTAPPVLPAMDTFPVTTAMAIPESMMMVPAPNTPLSAPITGSLSRIETPRLSTGNSSESDVPLKRSQRSRKPNKFYGYTSDDETPPLMNPLASKNPEKSILSVMKPTPPPNLVWSKEDLPSPPSMKSKGSKLKQTDHSTPVSSRVPPSAVTPTQPLPPQRTDPARIPMVTSTHSIAPTMINAAPQRNDHESDSSQEDTSLQANHRPIKTHLFATTPPSVQPQPLPPLPKLKLSLSKKISAKGGGTPKTPSSGRKRGPSKNKTPKSAPPVPVAMPKTRPELPSTAAAAAAVSAPPFRPPIVDPIAPKVPPIGSFPSIHTEFFPPNQIRIPAGWRPPREGESVYCYCRCPYDEVSEMIACDGDNCRIEWFHFECVGIIMPPKGKWFCPECKMKQLGGIEAAGGSTVTSGASAPFHDDSLDSS